MSSVRVLSFILTIFFIINANNARVALLITISYLFSLCVCMCVWARLTCIVLVDIFKDPVCASGSRATGNPFILLAAIRLGADSVDASRRIPLTLSYTSVFPRSIRYMDIANDACTIETRTEVTWARWYPPIPTPIGPRS